MSTFTTNKSIEQPANGSYNDDWDVPVNGDWAIIDNAFGGNTPISVTGVSTGVYTLTLAQYQPPNIIFSGVMAGNLTYVVPAGVGGQWSVYNNTSSGTFTLSFGSGGGGSGPVAIPRGFRALLICDGTNMQVATGIGSSGATPTALVGLTAKTGVAYTFTASDSAPALDQSIAPVWTATHIFDAGIVLGSSSTVFASLTLEAGGSFNANGKPVTVTTVATSDNSTNAASTAFVKSLGYAPLASPAFTGVPTVPTAANGTANTQAASTAFAVGTPSIGSAGYQLLPSGIIFQWGRSAGGASPQSVTFPLAFPTACFSIVCTPSSSSVMNFAVSAPSSSTSGFTITASDVDPCSWFAIGH